mmetsp:Transcript_7239/g.17016  ORF Transcript_7239/g.17016 Transcript_7239/m.17016 type:complete len:515 (+) Transcript_7239:813-2357(+)
MHLHTHCQQSTDKKTSPDAIKARKIYTQPTLPKNIKGQSLQIEVQNFRKMLVRTMFQAGIPLSSVQDLKPFLMHYAQCDPGSARAIADYIPSILLDLKKDVADRLKKCAADGKPNFMLIHDGTPVFAEALAIMVRVVNEYDFAIEEYLIHLDLYSESFGGETMGNEILRLFDRYNRADKTNLLRGVLAKEKWLVCGTDRCATNFSALKYIKEKTDNGAKPFFVPCIPHGLSNTGKKMKIPFANQLRKLLNRMTKHKICKARTLFKEIFNLNPLQSGKVRWFCDLVHLLQIHGLDKDRLIEFAGRCLDSGYSKKTAANLAAKLDDKRFLAFAIVEMAAALDIGIDLCRLTYVLEGDAPLVFVAGKSLNDFESKFITRGFDSVELPMLAEAAKAAAALIDSDIAPAREGYANAKVAVADAQKTLDTAKREAHQAGARERSSTSDRSRRPRPQRNYAVDANPASAAAASQAEEREQMQSYRGAVRLQKRLVRIKDLIRSRSHRVSRVCPASFQKLKH